MRSKHIMLASLVMLAALSGQVPNLDDYGLSSVAVMSDAEGESIRGNGFSYSYSGFNMSGSLSFGGAGGGAGGSSSASGFGPILDSDLYFCMRRLPDNPGTKRTYDELYCATQKHNGHPNFCWVGIFIDEDPEDLDAWFNEKKRDPWFYNLFVYDNAGFFGPREEITV